MKKIIIIFMCVFLFAVSTSVGSVYAASNEILEFNYCGKVFTYSLIDNLKTSEQFDLNFEINKYNRFGSREERIHLLTRLIDAKIEKEIALQYLFPNLQKTINRIEKNINKTQTNAKLKINSNTEKVFEISPEIVGITLDKQSLFDQIFEFYINKKSLIFNIPIIKTYPQITKEKLKDFTNLKADFSTNISSSTLDRKHNIKNALSSLNKIEVAPNEVFSFNKTVGKRSLENGYRNAKIIINNEFVDGVGGGVCQVSSTLYNAALLAGLEIIEANKHSKQVSYVKSGFDAMVNFGSSDLKFKNNTTEKIIIITNFSQTTARIRIFGESNGDVSYKLTNEVFNIVEPKEEIFVDDKQEYLEKVTFDDEFFFLKTPTKGLEVKSYREKYVNNMLTEKQLLRHDKFKVQNAVKIYGSQKRIDKNEKSTEHICA